MPTVGGIYGVGESSGGGSELDYVPFTSQVSITAVTEATANVVVTANPIVNDGLTLTLIEVFIPSAIKGTTYTQLWLFEKIGAAAAASIGAIGVAGVGSPGVSLKLERELIPPAGSIVYSLRCSVDGGIGLITGGVGGAGVYVPGFIKQSTVL